MNVRDLARQIAYDLGFQQAVKEAQEKLAIVFGMSRAAPALSKELSWAYGPTMQRIEQAFTELRPHLDAQRAGRVLAQGNEQLTQVARPAARRALAAGAAHADPNLSSFTSIPGATTPLRPTREWAPGHTLNRYTPV